jgi:hypothetical protein
MRRPKLLFICGSLNQTTQMHQIANELPEYEHVFTPYYGDAEFALARRLGLLEHTIGGRRLGARCESYLHDHGLPIDWGGRNAEDAALVFHCSDLVYPKNIRHKPVVLVQEGMTDPESLLFPLVKRAAWLPRWIAGTSATGLSARYARFCVASEGFRELFAARGISEAKLRVTGVPNFDDCARYASESDFPLEGFVLVCTSDTREVFGFEDRRNTIERAVRLAAGRPLVFKLHPNEDGPRATREIVRWAPGAHVFQQGSAERMLARAEVLMCTYSSLALVGTALGKEVHSRYSSETLARLCPEQHGRAAANIAAVARELLAAARTEPATSTPANLGAVA